MDLVADHIQQADRYRLLIGAIVPRPIAFVSSVSPLGAYNLAPFSFFCGVGSNPMSLAFCPANRADGSEKDTLRNCTPPEEGGTGEFVVNIAHEHLIRSVAAAAADLPHGESEFELARLTPSPWEGVRPPRVEECGIAFACRTRTIIRMNPGVPAGGNLVLGEVFRVHVDDSLVDERLRIDQTKLGAVGRMGGLQYCRTLDRFELPMGARALDAELPFDAPDLRR
jgi:flavin reductase (DIM6/NTAB) family NADH-FMN oxidoreductase RutF